MMNPLPITDADVNAYVDGQLAPSRAPAIEEALARDPALAARVADLRRQNATLHDAFDPWLEEPLPDRLIVAAAGAAPAGRRAAPKWLGITTAAAASLIVGIALGWLGRDFIITAMRSPGRIALSIRPRTTASTRRLASA